MALYHITTRKAWEEAKSSGSNYTAPSLQEVGFIHLSTEKQYVKSANRFFRGQHDLVLLEIDANKLTSELKYEHIHDGEDPFPHLYGELNLDAVVKVYKFEQVGDTDEWKLSQE